MGDPTTEYPWKRACRPRPGVAPAGAGAARSTGAPREAGGPGRVQAGRPLPGAGSGFLGSRGAARATCWGRKPEPREGPGPGRASSRAPGPRRRRGPCGARRGPGGPRTPGASSGGEIAFFPVRRAGAGIGAGRPEGGGGEKASPVLPGPRGAGAGATPEGKSQLEAAAGPGWPRGEGERGAGRKGRPCPHPSFSGGLSQGLQVCVWRVELGGDKTRLFSVLAFNLVEGEVLPRRDHPPHPNRSALQGEHRQRALSSGIGTPASVSSTLTEPSLLRMTPSLGFPFPH